jgi:thiopurine S-methyltransferase
MSSPDDAPPLPPVSDPHYWDAAYREGRDAWELGEAAPPLDRALRGLAPSSDAAVLGCGRGHEVRLLASLGWRRVVGVDFAQAALDEARARTEPGLPVEWLHDDVLALGGDHPEAFDLVVEHTCYCAIHPATRDAWAGSVAGTLRRGGVLVALFYTHRREGGPPWGATIEEIVARLEAHGFTVEHCEVPEDSVDKRRGDETLVMAQKR